NTEETRGSAVGSGGSPHVGGGTSQPSKKAESRVESPAFFFYLLFVGERSPEKDKPAGGGFERGAATARGGAARTPAINCQASNK
ncbi:hypothetical protein, partial [Klebsiella pneumoniae]|uniref:hypothetical protein n=1 Tax=Klebsiella pneumoniae TaxID=573 RepID=UPI002731B23E